MSSFLNSQNDIIIFCACIGGAVAILIIVASIGCCCEQCDFFKSKNQRKRKPMYSRTQELPVNVFTVSRPQIDQQEKLRSNYAQSWLYDTMISEQMYTVEEYINEEKKGRNKFSNRDPVHYINEVFSDIYDENEKVVKGEKPYGFDQPNRMIRPEKRPTAPKAYPKNEGIIANGSIHTKSSKAPLKNDAMKLRVKNGFDVKAAPLDDLDFDLFDLEEEKNEAPTPQYFNQFTIGEKIKARNHQSAAKTNNKFDEDENLKRLSKEVRNHKERRTPHEDDVFDQDALDAIDYNPRKNIPKQPPPVFSSMKQNVTQDSFLY